MAGTDFKSTLHHYLQTARRAMVWKLDDLSEYDSRRPLVRRGTNLLGLVKHLSYVELAYFGETFGRPSGIPSPWSEDDAEDNVDMWATADESRQEVVGRYRRAWAHADVTIAALDLSSVGRVPWWGDEEVTLHQILVHVGSETYRHLGHADLLRELVDGGVGRAADDSNMPERDDAAWFMACGSGQDSGAGARAGGHPQHLRRRRGVGYVSKVWFITGASKGFGREWAQAALERGDQVTATARNPETLDALVETYGASVLALKLDVTDRAADQAAVNQAAEHFGRLDVVINNAGYGHFGMVEELTEEELRAQLETNLFGAVWVTQAALPIMRQQGSGHIIQVSSIGGISAFPTVGAYHASKWALEGLSQSLSQEVAGFGIHVTLIEPGGYSTDWSGPSAMRSAENPVYADVREAAKSRPSASSPGDPTATRAPILKIVDAEPPPLRVFFGKAPLGIATKDYESRLATWNEWQPVSLEAQGS